MSSDYEQNEPNQPNDSGGNGRSSLNLFSVIESVILAMSVGLMLWVANLVVEHGKILSSHATMLQIDNSRLDTIESRGSPSLAAHVVEDNAEMSAVRARLDKVESAVVVLQATPGELRAITVRLEGIKEAQTRMEKALDAVAARTKP